MCVCVCGEYESFMPICEQYSHNIEPLLHTNSDGQDKTQSADDLGQGVITLSVRCSSMVRAEEECEKREERREKRDPLVSLSSLDMTDLPTFTGTEIC